MSSGIAVVKPVDWVTSRPAGRSGRRRPAATCRLQIHRWSTSSRRRDDPSTTSKAGRQPVCDIPVNKPIYGRRTGRREPDQRLDCGVCFPMKKAGRGEEDERGLWTEMSRGSSLPAGAAPRRGGHPACGSPSTAMAGTWLSPARRIRSRWAGRRAGGTTAGGTTTRRKATGCHESVMDDDTG